VVKPVTETVKLPVAAAQVTPLIVGGSGGFTTWICGAGLGITEVPFTVSCVTLKVMVPAVVPRTTLQFAQPVKVAVVEFAGMANWTDWLPLVKPTVPSLPLKVSARVPFTATGNTLLSFKLSVGCVPGVGEIPPIVSVGSAGRLMLKLTLAVAVAPLASVTVTDTELVPAAVGVPPN
jgi:hypothetical protein